MARPWCRLIVRAGESGADAALCEVLADVQYFAAGIGLSGCATYGQYGGLGVGIGYGSGGYGYDPYYGGGYYGGGYGSYGYNSPYGYGGYGYGSPYYGWYDGFYYPGSGYYVYDSYRRPHVWSEAQKRYWTERRQQAEKVAKTNKTVLKPNWDAFSQQQAQRRAQRIEQRNQRREQNSDRIQQRRETRTPTRTTTTTRVKADRPSAAERRRDRRGDD